MNKLDELIKNHTQQAKGYYEGHFLKPLHLDTAAALRVLKAVAEAADLAIDSGSVDEIHLSIIRDRLTALRAAGLMGGG